MGIENKVKQEPDEIHIDASTSPYTLHNIDSAKKLGLKYSEDRGAYIDKEGCIVRDGFGQPLG